MMSSVRWLQVCAVLLPATLTSGQCGEEEPVPEECPRAAGPVDGVRYVVVSHPYDSSGKAANTWEVLVLDEAGQLSRAGVTFRMGRATSGNIAFTPDGQVGIVAQEDGTLGVFTLDASGNVTVIHDTFEGSFYASAVVMDPSGIRAWVLDGNWPENGGGLYSVLIACDGTLYDEGLAVESKLAWAMDLLPGDPTRAVIGATSVGASSLHADAHLTRLEEPVEVEASSDAFGDDEAFIASVAVTSDGAFGLLSDNNEFSGTGNRLGVVSLESMAKVQVLNNLEDPIEVLASPFADTVLVVSGYGNAFYRLAYQPGASLPFSIAGQVAYQGSRPQLPGDGVVLRRGGLNGLTLVVENLGVRRLRFQGGGAIADLGIFSLGSSYTAIPGAIGVQP